MMKNTSEKDYRSLISLWQIGFSIVIAGFFQSCGSDSVTSQRISEDILDRVQEETFGYFWEGGEPMSGGARERIHMDGEYGEYDKDIITSGGTGFGVMTTLVGIERGFISREEGYDRLRKLTDWLGSSDRFHGAWPHWWTPDGKSASFSEFDNGGDIVETSFLAQGLLAARQYFKKGNEAEQALAEDMDRLWRSIEWDWYTRGENVIYWHWSPEHEWKMKFAITGYNECLITYILAVSSPTHPADPAVYHEGFMQSGKVVSPDEHFGIPEVLYHYGVPERTVGPLFWAHYSYLGLDPRGLKDRYADFWELNRNHVLIDYEYCLENPGGFQGYSEEFWGLSASYSVDGYRDHNPDNDHGVISPTAALSSFPYTPEKSARVLHFIYEEHPEWVGEYGPYDAMSLEADWFTPRYLAIDQLTIPVMIENYRTGLLWDLFMSAPEIQQGLDRLGFEYKKRDVY